MLAFNITVIRDDMIMESHNTETERNVRLHSGVQQNSTGCGTVTLCNNITAWAHA